MPPALFIHSFPPDRRPPRVHEKVGAWYGHKGDKSYEGVTLSFFKTIRGARASFSQLVWLYGGRRLRNVVVAWEQRSTPTATLRRSIIGCLRTEPDGTLTPSRSQPEAGLATFAGYWGGHTRGLRISPSGRAYEFVDSGCCVREYRSTFQILSVRGTLTRATAAYRVTAFKRYSQRVPRQHVGQVGRLLLRDGIVTNTLTTTYFCSSPAWSATGACGA